MPAPYQMNFTNARRQQIAQRNAPPPVQAQPTLTPGPAPGAAQQQFNQRGNPTPSRANLLPAQQPGFMQRMYGGMRGNPGMGQPGGRYQPDSGMTTGQGLTGPAYGYGDNRWAAVQPPLNWQQGKANWQPSAQQQVGIQQRDAIAAHNAILNNPNLTPDQMQAAWAQYQQQAIARMMMGQQTREDQMSQTHGGMGNTVSFGGAPAGGGMEGLVDRWGRTVGSGLGSAAGNALGGPIGGAIGGQFGRWAGQRFADWHGGPRNTNPEASPAPVQPSPFDPSIPQASPAPGEMVGGGGRWAGNGGRTMYGGPMSLGDRAWGMPFARQRAMRRYANNAS